MSLQQQKHPLITSSVEEKVAFLSLVATIASADKKITADETDNLLTLCEEIKLPKEKTGEVISALRHPEEAPVEKYAEQLKDSDLKYTLLVDMYFLAYADDKLVSDEAKEINAFSERLNINEAQTKAIAKYAKVLHEHAKGKSKSKKILKETARDLTASLAAAGVPVIAVSTAGFAGLSAAGITSGLAVLGVGFGMAGGIGAVVALGLGSYFGVQWLAKKIMNEK
jgi:uncharacterized tellurite resistance protein B-like protein